MNIIKKIILFLILFVPFNVFSLSLNTTNKEAILINLNDNNIIYEQNINEKTSIASLTKMMTAIVAISNIDNLEEKVTLIKEDFNYATKYNLSLSGYKLNTSYTYKDLLYGLLLSSGADCSNALARNISGDVNSFIKLMNDKATELNMTNTLFSNPVGYDDSNNYSTAYDMYLLFNFAKDNDVFMNIIKTMEYKAYDGTKITHTIDYYIKKYNINMPYLLGGKTGYDTKANYCLASIATYNNVDYMLIVLNSKYDKNKPNHFIDSNTIYKYYMDNYSYKTVFYKDNTLATINTISSKEKIVFIKSDKDYSYYLENNYNKDKITTKYNGKESISYKNKINEKLGTLDVYYDNILIDTIDIYLKETLHFSLISYLIENPLIIYSLVITLIFLFIMLLIIRYKNIKKILNKKR